MKILYLVLFHFILSFSLQAQWIALPKFTTDPLISVDFKTPETGLICGANKIWRTTNGGDNWTTVYTGSNDISLEEVRWASDQVAVAVGLNDANNRGIILRSTDGGQSWTSINNTIISIFTDVFFVNENVGYLCGGNTRILKTTNGGASWTSQFSDNNSDLFSIHFINENLGYAGGGIAGIGRLLRTTNGGATWQDVSLSAPFIIQSVFFPSADVGYVAGVGGKMRKTANGGNDWTELTTANTSNILDLYFFDQNYGYLVGGTLSATSLQKTVNGGAFWSNDAPTAGAGLFSIDFAGTTGYGVGVNGTIVKTVVTVGADEPAVKTPAVDVFPNPVMAELHIKSKEQKLRSIEIFDTDGRLLKCIEVNLLETTVDVSKIPAGIFFIKIMTDNGFTVKKLYKN